MNAFARIDKDDFYRFVSSQTEGRYEYIRGRIVQQMTGGTKRHGLVARRIVRLVEDKIDAARWTVLGDRGADTEETVRYPDIAVEPADEPMDSLATKRPSLLVEVLSPSTSHTELDEKPPEYMSLESLDAYIVASQNEPALLIWQRGTDGRFPMHQQEIEGRDAIAKIAGRGFVLELPLATIYHGIG